MKYKMSDNNLEKYFVLYCDLLGFSDDMTEEGSGYIFDYYGAAWLAADAYPSINVYLISDTLLAFAKAEDASNFVGFISWLTTGWSADGLLPQYFIGYGTFVEGRSNFGRPVQNFFGSEVQGTALVDAAKLQKKKPLGSRIFISNSAERYLPKDQGANDSKALQIQNNQQGEHETLKGHYLSFNVLQNKDENLEFIFHDDGRRSSYDFYYLLRLCRRDRGRVFDHYVWSAASRAYRISKSEVDKMAKEAVSEYPDADIDGILNAINSVLARYKPMRR